MMKKMRKGVEDGMKLIWKKVDPKDLKPGDHIYAYKRYGSYSHHGIYVGGGYVIHFTRTEIKEAILPFSRVEPETVPACPECGYQENTGRGVIKTCPDCFRRGRKTLHSIHYFMYGVPRLGLLLKNSGTCSTLPCTRSPEQVVEVAYELLRTNGFDDSNAQRSQCVASCDIALSQGTRVRGSSIQIVYDIRTPFTGFCSHHVGVGTLQCYCQPSAPITNVLQCSCQKFLKKHEEDCADE